MRLELRDVAALPGSEKRFAFRLDLSDLDFYGYRPITRPVEVEGSVSNHAGALTLRGTARSLLDLRCDRCGRDFTREKSVDLDFLLAAELEDEENDEILLIEDGAVELEEAVGTAFVLAMDTKNLCKQDCMGLCPRCGADLNAGPCSCKAEIDPRLASLARLLEE